MAAKAKADTSCTVKNTFLEFSMPGENRAHKRRTRSDMDNNQDIWLSPLVVASKSPHASPLLGPMDPTRQAVPIDGVGFELLEESAIGEDIRFDESHEPGGPDMIAQTGGGMDRDQPAYIVPTTPSPFLHSAFPPSVVPPFNGYGSYGMPDMGLPPAFADAEGGGAGADGFLGQDVDGQYLQGMPFMPEMYDSGYGYGGWAGWGVPQEGGGEASFQQGEGAFQQGEAEDGVHGGAAGDAGHQEVDVVAEAVAALAAAAREQPEGRLAKEGRRERKDRKRGEPRKEDREEEWAVEPRSRARDQAQGGGAGDWGGGGGSGGAAGSGAAVEKRRAKESEEVASHEAGGAGGEDYTTVMLRNIPNKYTREMLIKQLNVEFGGLYDFMYLPIDFKNKCNVGYCFINFTNPQACELFITKFHGVDVRKCLPGLNSKKIVEVTPARVQGMVENVRRLKNSPVMNQLADHPEWMPLLFNQDGIEEPFPMPDNALPPIKARGRNREARNTDG